MAMRSDFYLILPSNSSKGSKTNEFRVRLPDPIELSGTWEVALVEIMYPHSWSNLTGLSLQKPPRSKEDLKEMYNTSSDDGKNVLWCSYKPLNGLERVIVPMGYYSTPEELIKAINKGFRHQHRVLRERVKLLKNMYPPKPGTPEDKIQPSKLPKLDKSVAFSYDRVLNRIKVKLDTSVVDNVLFSKHLEYMLGFDSGSDDLFIIHSKSTVAQHPVDLKGGFYSLYIYCDLVENQIIGSNRAQLLQIVPIEGQNSDIVTRTFHSPHYVTVLKKTFDSIEVCIKNDTNGYVPFDYGKCVLKLHFCKKRAIPL